MAILYLPILLVEILCGVQREDYFVLTRAEEDLHKIVTVVVVALQVKLITLQVILVFVVIYVEEDLHKIHLLVLVLVLQVKLMIV